ncbi:MAG: hypothetical protein OEL55_05700, partial [Desulfobulbaceae bacterium]|nr:hypothetical protein [Desulfobulbaceae bacterium]
KENEHVVKFFPLNNPRRVAATSPADLSHLPIRPIMTNNNNDALESDALKANLLETAVDEVTIDPAFSVLSEIVVDYQGIRNNLEELLYEVSHPFHNWNMIVPRLRAFVLKNNGHFRRHAKGPQSVPLFARIFFDAIAESGKNEALLGQAIEGLLAYLDNLIASLDPATITDYESQLAYCWERLAALDDVLLIHVVQGHHPMKKIALKLLDFATRQGESAQAYDLRPLGHLMARIFSRNYQYWLSEEDPLPWFAEECGDMCEGWQAGQLFGAISHQRLREHQETLKGIDIEANPADLAKVLELPSHMDIVRLYKEVPSQLVASKSDESSEENDRFAENRKLLFLFRIMDTAALP